MPAIMRTSSRQHVVRKVVRLAKSAHFGHVELATANRCADECSLGKRETANER